MLETSSLSMLQTMGNLSNLAHLPLCTAKEAAASVACTRLQVKAAVKILVLAFQNMTASNNSSRECKARFKSKRDAPWSRKMQRQPWMATEINPFPVSCRLSVVKSYCGHGIGDLFHVAPNVPHYSHNKVSLNLTFKYLAMDYFQGVHIIEEAIVYKGSVLSHNLPFASHTVNLSCRLWES